MITLLQRVSHAEVEVDHTIISSIEQGLLVLVGFQPADSQQQIDKLLKRIIHYRIFEDQQQKMNLSLTDIGGELLIVPQFTLAADTQKGLRPGFSTAATPELGEKLYDCFIKTAQQLYPKVQHGTFAANMNVSLTNAGPATFWLEI